MSSISISLDNLESNLRKESFKLYMVAMSTDRLAIALNNHLMITSIIGEIDPEDGIPFAPRVDSMVPLEERYDRCSALQWLGDDIICVGFESGIIVCFNVSGNYLFEQKFHDSSVQSIRVTDRPVTLSTIAGLCVFILHEDGHLVAVALAALQGIPALLARTGSSTLNARDRESTATLVAALKFRFTEEATTDFLVVPSNNYTSCPPVLNAVGPGELLFDSVLTGGFNSTVSYHHLVVPQPAASVGRLITHLKNKVSKAVSQSVNNAFSSFFGLNSSSVPEPTPAPAAAVPTPKARLDLRQASTGYQMNDGKRRILRLSADPTGKLIATADTLGRVMLFDSRVHCMVRLWKGVRDARFAWTVGFTAKNTGGEDKGKSPVGRQLRTRKSLSLAIYAPQLGLLSIWAMRHGPCIRTIAIGFQTQIFTIYDVCSETGASTAKCAVMKLSVDETTIEISTVSPQESDVQDVDMSALLQQRERERSSELQVGRSVSGGADGGVSDFLGEFQVGGHLLSEDGSDDDALLQLRELLCSAQASEPGRRGSGTGGSTGGFRAADSVASVPGSAVKGLNMNVHLDASTPMTTTGSSAGRGLGFAVLKDSDPRKREERICAMIKRLLDPAVSRGSGTNTPSSRYGCLSSAAARPAGPGGSVSAAAVEADIWMGLSHVSSTTVLASCIEFIDAAERSRLSKYTCSDPGALSDRFSMQFHHSVCDLMVSVGKKQNDAKFVIVGLMRHRLLRAFELLIKFSQNVDNTIFSLGAKRGVVQTAQSMYSGSSNEVSQLVKQNTRRAEAFCWLSRMHSKLAQTDEIYQEGEADAPPAPVRVSSPGGGSTSTSLPPQPPTLARQTSSNASLMSYFSPSSSPMVSPSVSSANVKHVDSGSTGVDAAGSRRQSQTVGSQPLTFAMFLAFHRLVWHKIPAGGVGVTGEEEDEEGCCSVEFRSEEVLRLLHGNACQAFKPSYHKQSKCVSELGGDCSGMSGAGGSSGGLGGVGSSSANLTPSTAGHKAATHLSFKSNTPTNITPTQGIATPGPGSAPQSGPNTPGQHSQRHTPTPVLPEDTTQAQCRCEPIDLAPLAVPGDDNSPDPNPILVWAPPVWAVFETLALLMSPLVMQLDVFVLHAYNGSVLEHMGLGGGWGLRHFLPLLVCYIEHVLSPLQSVTAVMNILLYKQQISTAPLQRWLRDVLLSFQDALRVDQEEEKAAQQSIKSRVATMVSERSPDPDLVEYLNDHYALLAARTNFIRLLVGSGGCLGANSAAPITPAPSFGFGKKRTNPSPIFSYDDSIRFALRPMWLSLRRSTFCAAATEVTMGICAVSMEIMTAVSEQLERRTYGVDNLWHTVLSWDVLFKQTRVAALLASRVDGNSLMALSSVSVPPAGPDARPSVPRLGVSVRALNRGDVSIYRLLAQDTLCFTTQADQAAEHEARCNEVYLKRVVTNSRGGVPSAAGSGAGVSAGLLMAWGFGADQRWRELLSLVEAEDAEHAAAQNELGSSNDGAAGNTAGHAVSGRAIRRRKPLLLLFPLHNQSEPLSAYRGLILAERWAETPRAVDLLSASVSHLYPLPPATRSAVAEHICDRFLNPFIKSYLLLEELAGFNSGSHVSSPVNVKPGSKQMGVSRLHTPPRAGTLLVDTSESHPQIRSEAETETETEVPLPEIPKDFLQMVRNGNGRTEMLREFIQTALDMLAFVTEQGQEQGHGLGYTSPSSAALRKTTISSQVDTFGVDGISVAVREVREELGSLSGVGEAPTTTEINNSVWPAFTDPRLVGLVEQLEQCGGANSSAVKTHCAVLLVILLRNLCNLRRIKPSELFAGDVPLLEYICAPGALTKAFPRRKLFSDAGKPPNPTPSPGTAQAKTQALHRIRAEFILQCFLCLQYHYSAAVYRLSELWFGGATAQVDAAKILHIKALLEGRNDDIVEEVASQVGSIQPCAV